MDEEGVKLVLCCFICCVFYVSRNLFTRVYTATYSHHPIGLNRSFYLSSSSWTPLQKIPF